MTPVEERIDHEGAKQIAERTYIGIGKGGRPDHPMLSVSQEEAGILALAYKDLLTEHFAREEALLQLLGRIYDNERMWRVMPTTIAADLAAEVESHRADTATAGPRRRLGDERVERIASRAETWKLMRDAWHEAKQKLRAGVPAKEAHRLEVLGQEEVDLRAGFLKAERELDAALPATEPAQPPQTITNELGTWTLDDEPPTPGDVPPAQPEEEPKP